MVFNQSLSKESSSICGRYGNELDIPYIYYMLNQEIVQTETELISFINNFFLKNSKFTKENNVYCCVFSGPLSKDP